MPRARVPRRVPSGRLGRATTVALAAAGGALSAAFGWPWGLVAAGCASAAAWLTLRWTSRTVSQATRRTEPNLPVVPPRPPAASTPAAPAAESPLVARLHVDADGRFTAVCGLAERLLGASRDALLGASADVFLPKLLDVARAGRSGRRRWTLRTSTETLAVDVSVQPAASGGAIIELVDVSVDARALAEARATQRDALAARGELERLLRSYGVAVRARAGEMTELLTLLEGEPLSDELTAPLRHAHAASATLLTVTDDIIALVRSGEAMESPLSPLTLVESVMRRRAASEPAKASWLIAVAPRLELLVIGDVARLERALDNLVTHATTVARSGVVEVRVATSDHPAYGRATLAFTLRDAGPPRRFGDGSWTGPAGDSHALGAGLELYLARALVAPLGGEVSVEDDGGRGQRMTLTCPVVRPALAPTSRAVRLDGLRVTLRLSRREEESVLLEYLEDRGARVRRAPTLGPGDATDVLVTELGHGAVVSPHAATILLGSGAGPDDGRTHLRRPVMPSTLVAAVAELGNARREGTDAAPASLPTSVEEPRGRALLVDDDNVNQLVAARMLEDLGFGVTVTANGLNALAAARAGGFDVILMDWHLPGLDGLEVTRRLRSDAGAASDVPIIALTGRVMPDDIAACRAAGMDAHLPKPLTRTRLAETLAECLPAATSRTTPRPSPR